MPNRILKESICSSDTIDELSWFEEVFFYRLIVTVDDFGRFDARIPILKSRMFPLKNVTERQIEDALNKLKSVDIVTTYMVEAKPYLQIVTWQSHQTIRNKKSRYPGIEEADSIIDDNSALEINCNQLNANVPVIQSNPIQSESNPNPNPYPSSDDDFERWWAEYPKKVGKANAKKIFKRLKPSKALVEQMIRSVQSQALSDQWRKNNGQFISNPATWLNQGRWEDEPVNVRQSAVPHTMPDYQPTRIEDDAAALLMQAMARKENGDG